MEDKKLTYFQKHKIEIVIAACSLAFVLLVIGFYVLVDELNLGLKPNYLTLTVTNVEYDEEEDEYLVEAFDAADDK